MFGIKARIMARLADRQMLVGRWGKALRAHQAPAAKSKSPDWKAAYQEWRASTLKAVRSADAPPSKRGDVPASVETFLAALPALSR